MKSRVNDQCTDTVISENCCARNTFVCVNLSQRSVQVFEQPTWASSSPSAPLRFYSTFPYTQTPHQNPLPPSSRSSHLPLVPRIALPNQPHTPHLRCHQSLFPGSYSSLFSVPCLSSIPRSRPCTHHLTQTPIGFLVSVPKCRLPSWRRMWAQVLKGG